MCLNIQRWSHRISQLLHHLPNIGQVIMLVQRKTCLNTSSTSGLQNTQVILGQFQIAISQQLNVQILSRSWIKRTRQRMSFAELRIQRQKNFDLGNPKIREIQPLQRTTAINSNKKLPTTAHSKYADKKFINSNLSKLSLFSQNLLKNLT